MKKIILLTSIFLVSIVNAQNLIENGDFEKSRSFSGQTKFEGWDFNRYLTVQKVQGYKGYGAKVYTNGATFRVVKQGNSNAISIEGNKEYTLVFWCKGQTGGEKVEPIITWYDQNGNPLGAKKELGKISPQTAWGEKTFTFVSPSVAVMAGLYFKVSDRGEAFFIDEVSLKKTGEGVAVPAPTGFQSRAFQREIEFWWDNGLPNTKWELIINGQSEILEPNRYIATKLTPNTDYKVKIRAIIESKKSDFIEKNIRTQNFTKSKSDLGRVPHLRTLTIDGTPPQTIDLFFNDLYNIDAEIQYFIDDKTIMPTNNQLHFDKKGKQTLKMLIKEEEGLEWEIEYKLNVK